MTVTYTKVQYFMGACVSFQWSRYMDGCLDIVENNVDNLLCLLFAVYFILVVEVCRSEIV